MSPRPPLPHDKRKAYSNKEVSTFAKNLLKRRLEIGMKQSELAESIGITESHISRYEGGVFPNHPERIAALAKALNCSLDYLFGLSDIP